MPWRWIITELVSASCKYSMTAALGSIEKAKHELLGRQYGTLMKDIVLNFSRHSLAVLRP